jgi:hypothetical protein
MLRAALPLLKTITVCDALVVPTDCAANPKAVGEIINIGAGGVPTPVRGIDCTLPVTFPESSVIVRIALNVPVVDGTKETCAVQLDPAETIFPDVQEFCPSENCATFPEKLKFVICSG